MQSSHQIFEVAIVGTGFGGLCMAIQLKKAAENNFVVFEQGTAVGGTWRDNTYPGAACDVRSHLYSFSFEPKADWSHKYARQPEILEYLERCARKYQLNTHIRFNTEIAQAAFDEAGRVWKLHTAAGEIVTARMVVFACGQLNRPMIPDIHGLDVYKGARFHSARWDHSFDYAHKKIAVIGTGASAIQFVPELVKKAAQVLLFQRSAAWVIPKNDRPYTPFEKQLLARFDWLRKLYRSWIYWSSEIRFLALNPNSLIHRGLTRLGLKHIRDHVADPVLRQKLTPDYPAGCKRILISNNYYQALAQPHVQVLTGQIDSVTERGVMMEGREYEADAIIYGTGFQSTGFLSPIRITGRQGLDLNEAWTQGAEAYLGITLAGFPNFFMLYGPNTNLSHNSIVFMIEAQVRHILRCMSAVKDRQKLTIEPKREVQARYNRTLQDSLKKAIWSVGCRNWYIDKGGKNTNNWSGFSFSYRRQTEKMGMENYILN